ncbi:hypothetical protein PCANC_04631 [Puccinia coronata f. sp. avenae]|uniref:Uncharacterized protein n=1 Tax=Puccinia coronata f. sp. avenae TaxID=200324 RepID=A0A2N5W075_9BASI|nr:hypothetical protein PCANC_04631 [Puccinia coronata f. sp. avenae]
MPVHMPTYPFPLQAQLQSQFRKWDHCNRGFCIKLPEVSQECCRPVSSAPPGVIPGHPTCFHNFGNTRFRFLLNLHPMPTLNLTAIGASLRCVFTPRSLLPTLHVRDIRCINWKELKRNGYVGVVIDKDNCITKPYHDQLVPELQDAWQSCLSTFGDMSVLLVSNSAGTGDDPALIQAESVARHLGVPVLVHATKKPGQEVVRAIEEYFTTDRRLVPVIYPPSRSNTESQSPPTKRTDGRLKLIVIGDRVTTDILLASRLRAHLQSHQSTVPATSSPESNPVCSVLTREIWQKEKLGTRFMRWAENRALKLAREHSASIATGGATYASRKIPSPTTWPEYFAKRSDQALLSSSQIVSKTEETKDHLHHKYRSISAKLIELSQQSAPVVIGNFYGIVQDTLSHQLGKLSLHCGRAWLRVKIALRQHVNSALENLRNRALQMLARSANKVQLKLQSSDRLDPTALGFRKPLFIQHLSKWRQLK